MGIVCKVVFKDLRLQRKGQRVMEKEENSKFLGNSSIKRIGRKANRRTKASRTKGGAILEKPRKDVLRKK